MLLPILPQSAISGAIPHISLDYNGDYADVDIFSAAGSPSSPATITVNMASGTDFYASTTGNYACDCDGFASGSTVIFNMINSRISGKGGAGGSGGGTEQAGSTGGVGGPAIRLGCATTFNSISGSNSVNGGGGGGGGGGAGRGSVEDLETFVYTHASGGNGGNGESYNSSAQSGASGGSAANATGGNGGAGGSFGTSGSGGSAGSGTHEGGGSGPTSYAGGASGAGGVSIKTQGFSYSAAGVTINGSTEV